MCAVADPGEVGFGTDTRRHVETGGKSRGYVGAVRYGRAHPARGNLKEGMTFISRRVMDDWVDPRQPYGRRQSLFREQYNALGKRNLSIIQRIVALKYQRGAAFNRQHPFVDVLLSDITESGEVLDVSELKREPSARSAQSMQR